MINKYNTYKIKIAGKKYKKCIALPTMFQDPYEYRMKEMTQIYYIKVCTQVHVPLYLHLELDFGVKYDKNN